MADLKSVTDALNLDSIGKLIMDAASSWVAMHGKEAQELGEGAGEAVVILAVIKALPSSTLSPDLNIMKMQMAARLLKLSSDNKVKLAQLQASADELFMSVIKQALTQLGGAALKAVLAALV